MNFRKSVAGEGLGKKGKQYYGDPEKVVVHFSITLEHQFS